MSVKTSRMGLHVSLQQVRKRICTTNAAMSLDGSFVLQTAFTNKLFWIGYQQKYKHMLPRTKLLLELINEAVHAAEG